MKPKHSGNIVPSPGERLKDKVPGGVPKAAPGGIQPPKHAGQGRSGFKCYDKKKGKG